MHRPSDQIDYTILGESIQVVEVELDPGETVVAEAGAMLYMEEGIQFQTKMGDGSDANSSILGKLFQAGSRLLMGESLFMTHFTNQGGRGTAGKARVGFSAPYPGTIMPVQLSQMSRNELLVQKDAFLCAALGTKISIALNKRMGSGFFGGEGFILQKLQGDGLAFIHAGGTIIERQLNNDTLRVDTGCIVGFESTIDYDIQRAGDLKSMIFGGEGIFLATLRGTGKVWLQSMPVRKLIQALMPTGQNSKKGSSSVLGQFLED
ncbi:TIGR00266 family protein [Cesiribacter andamanensis]|nr:TIGR00266 family protein [Cesiribacter andamanensis]